MRDNLSGDHENYDFNRLVIMTPIKATILLTPRVKSPVIFFFVELIIMRK